MKMIFSTGRFKHRPEFSIRICICVGHSPQTRSFAPAALLTRVRHRNFCGRKRPSFLASRRFAWENPTPCSHSLSGIIQML